ncbi:hypothetical protein G6F70_002406 [Rhizopus microsporus]|nr:hypothetical protein G6F71_005038 [Rhizopus microsporus]KAG1202260.1 hypothetical protein G6F70_002406 [Rhizopus microsporus]KAG1214778.1 hypothetical protein G6F69_001604 [Rhizopus microsporus]KAG1232972.1 hypothetical protein G6F67_004618 [Rhizopus microsporus]KAG1264988.1 hypothetical protein G6F68_003938 [Rhizopus microsporus]
MYEFTLFILITVVYLNVNHKQTLFYDNAKVFYSLQNSNLALNGMIRRLTGGEQAFREREDDSTKCKSLLNDQNGLSNHGLCGEIWIFMKDLRDLLDLVRSRAE